MTSDCKTAQSFAHLDDVVISGISGRFPESDNFNEFADNLYSNKDLITEDERRWPINLNGLSNRIGKVKGVKQFDSQFFGIPETVANDTDPQSRLLLETTFEAIFDAGIDASTLRKSNTGVYIGFSTIGTAEGIPQTDEEVTQNAFQMLGTSRAIYANRINFAFDFCGPSTIMDTACASSMSALLQAWNDIRNGACDQAVVGGVNLCLAPFSNYLMTAVGAVSPTGQSCVFDERANGYVRSEACVTVFLQKKSVAKRVYATILNCRSNTDGYKKPGPFFPSSQIQSNLMSRVCSEAGVDPKFIKYFEAHGTGTRVGDPQEVRAIARVFCNDERVEPLLIGSVKSNLGHTEGASGLVSIAKVLLAFELNVMAANRNFEIPNEDIKNLIPHKIKVNTESTPFNGGIVGINSYGIGGGNVNLLLKSNDNQLNNSLFAEKQVLPLLTCFSGRTQQSVEYFFNFIQSNPNKMSRDFHALLNHVMHFKAPVGSNGFPYRGFCIVRNVAKNVDSNKKTSLFENQKISTKISGEKKPVCFVFSGFGSQWPAMAKALMPLKRFSQTIEELSNILQEFHLNLEDILMSEKEDALQSVTSVFVGVTAIQIALIDIFNEIHIKPDIIVGHSFGEIACAYADGCLTAREAILCSLFRGKCIEKASIAEGLMIAVGLKWEEAVIRCENYNVFAACHNSEDSVTISGLKDRILDLEKQLIEEKVFVRRVRGVTVPFHSLHMNNAKDILMKELVNVIKCPKKRQLNRWISSSVEMNESSLYASPEYFVNNLIKPVLFYEALKKVPQDCIFIEIAPHSLFETIFKRSFGNLVTYLGVLKRDNNEKNLNHFFSTIGELYLKGLSPRIENLYPKFEFPVVRGTQSLSSLLKWKHDIEYNVRLYPDHYNRSTASNYIYYIQLGPNSRWNFLRDHVIDGTTLFPATAYLMLVWQSFAANKHIPWKKLAIHFSNIKIIKGSIISEENSTKFIVNINEMNGQFYVIVGSNIGCTGMVSIATEPVLLLNEFYENSVKETNDQMIRVARNQWYDELRVHGYDYGNKFKGLLEGSEDGRQGVVRWTGEWISFADSMLHLMPFTKELKSETILVPTFFESIRCDPQKLFKVIQNETKAQLNTDEESIGTKHDIKFPVFYDQNLDALYSNCLEIRGFQSLPIPRKNMVKGLCLEKHVFIANHENEAIDENDKISLQKYDTVFNYIFKKAIEKLGPDFKNIDYHENGENGLSQTLIDEYLKKAETEEQYSLLQFFNQIKQDNCEPICEPIVDSKELVITALTRYGPKLRYDLLNNTFANERLLRTQLDIIIENTISQTVKILELNNRSTEPLNRVIIKWFSNTPLIDLEIDYSLAQTQINYITEEVIDPTVNLLLWTENEPQLPKSCSNMDLVIYNCISTQFESTELLKSIFDSIKENGFVLLIMRSKHTNSHKFLQSLSSSETLKLSCDENLVTICEKIGFKTVSIKSDSIAFKTIMLRKPVKNLVENQTLIEVKNGSFDEWVEVLKAKMIEHKNKPIGENIWLYTKDSYLNGIVGLVNCLRKESGGERIRCLVDMDYSFPQTINLSEDVFNGLVETDLVFNIHCNSKWGTFRHLRLREKVSIPFIKTKHCYVNCLKRGDINTLRWFESPDHEYLEKKENQVLIDVFYAGINDKDVDYVYNRSQIEPKFAKHECLIGQEFCGLRKDNGSRVMGIRFSASIATEVMTDSDLVFDIPDNWSLAEAATVPLSYFTCYYSLIIKCDLQEKESVLITSANSCLGQAAIAICLDKNCRVFGSVGNEIQRQKLLNKFENKLNKEHIFIDSKIGLKDHVLTQTNGRGVDVVFNTGNKFLFESCLQCLKNCGKFIDLYKQHILDNNNLPMIALRKNITYNAIDIDYILRYLAFGVNPNPLWNIQVKKVHQLINCGLRKGVILPYSPSVYRRESIAEVFRSHSSMINCLSKIVIQIRDQFISHENELTVLASPRNWFNPKKVYIITGGLGGFGFQLAVWMIERGAKQLVLTSRTGPKNQMQKLFLRRFQSIGASVQISNRDLKSREDARLLIEESQVMGGIGGIFHLAVVLDDNLFENQSSISFKRVFDTKFQSLLFLDEITRHLCPDLEYFVAFSSISCGRGNQGQSNYGFANSSVERLCEDRREHGFHGLAIQWGPIDDVGLVFDKSRETDKNVRFNGLIAQRMPTCFTVLDMFLRLPYPVVSTLTSGQVMTRKINPKDSLLEQLATYLGTESKKFADSSTLEDIGVDSLMSVEVQKRLEREFERSIPFEMIKNITVGQLRTENNGRDALMKIFSVKKS